VKLFVIGAKCRRQQLIAAADRVRVWNHYPLHSAEEITTVTDKDGNKYRVLLVDDRACQGGGCCVTCGKKGGETIDR
jgi:hypothetical protein